MPENDHNQNITKVQDKKSSELDDLLANPFGDTIKNPPAPHVNTNNQMNEEEKRGYQKIN